MGGHIKRDVEEKPQCADSFLYCLQRQAGKSKDLLLEVVARLLKAVSERLFSFPCVGDAADIRWCFMIMAYV